jgi:hypothetical protein
MVIVSSTSDDGHVQVQKLRQTTLVEIGNLVMNTVERTALARELPAALPAQVGLRVARTRGFLLQILAREILIRDRSADWLCAAAERLAWGEDERKQRLAGDCVRLAAETLAVQAELVRFARRLVDLWNRGTPERRVDLVALLAESPSEAMIELFELLDEQARSERPWAVLALVRPVEQMLATVVPLAIDAGIAQEELRVAAELYTGHARRAEELAQMLATLDLVETSETLAVVEDQASRAFSKLLVECAEIGQALDRWRHSPTL